MTTEPILFCASRPSRRNLTFRCTLSSQADAERRSSLRQPSGLADEALLATHGRELYNPMPTTPSEGHQYLRGPANFACAWVYRIFIGEEDGEQSSA